MTLIPPGATHFPRFGKLYELGSDIMSRANTIQDSCQGQTGYLNYMYTQTHDDVFKPKNIKTYGLNVELLDLPNQRGLLATNTGKIKDKDELSTFRTLRKAELGVGFLEESESHRMAEDFLATRRKRVKTAPC